MQNFQDIVETVSDHLSVLYQFAWLYFKQRKLSCHYGDMKTICEVLG